MDINALTNGLRNATEEELLSLKNLSDDDLLRCSQTLDLFSVVESNRRLKNALQKEECTMKWLTLVLVVLTVVLVIFGSMDFIHKLN